MRKSVLGLTLVTALSVASMPTFAGVYEHQKKMGTMERICDKIPGVCAKMQEMRTKKPYEAEAKAVPEIDAANAGLALALLGGLVAIRRERRNRRQA